MSESRLPLSYMTPGTSSFADFLGVQAPDLLPSRRAVPAGDAGDLAPHGTTIVAATFAGGVVMAGDRRATMVVPCGARSPAWPWGTARRDGTRSGACSDRKSLNDAEPGIR